MAHEYEGNTGVRRSTKHAPGEKKQFVTNKPGLFAGWISQRWGVAWVVSPHRTDKRTGAIPWPKPPAPQQPVKKPRAKRFKGL